MRVKSIRGRQGGKLEGIFVVEIKTEINDSGRGELERGCLIFLKKKKNDIETAVGRKPSIFSFSSSIRAWCWLLRPPGCPLSLLAPPLPTLSSPSLPYLPSFSHIPTLPPPSHSFPSSYPLLTLLRLHSILLEWRFLVLSPPDMRQKVLFCMGSRAKLRWRGLGEAG